MALQRTTARFSGAAPNPTTVDFQVVPDMDVLGPVWMHYGSGWVGCEWDRLGSVLLMATTWGVLEVGFYGAYVGI